MPLSQGKAAQLCAAYIVSEFFQQRFVRAGVAAGFSSSHFLYLPLSLSGVFLFESISRVHYISFTYGRIHRTFSLFIFVKATFLVSVSSVFIREKEAKGSGEREGERKKEGTV